MVSIMTSERIQKEGSSCEQGDDNVKSVELFKTEFTLPRKRPNNDWTTI